MDGDEELEVAQERAPSPLRERLEQFRSGDDKPPAPAAGTTAPAGRDAGDDEEDEVIEQTPVPRPGGRTGEEEAGEEERPAKAPTEEELEEETETEREAREAREKAGESQTDAQGRPLRSIEIPTLEGDGKTSTLIIDGLPQEYYDSIQNHVRRSLRLDHVERRLGDAKKSEAIANFYTNDPLNAMRLVYRDRPEAAASFVENWIQLNPAEAAKFISKHFPEGRAKDTLDLQAKLAAREIADELDKAWDQVDSRTKHQDFADNASRLVHDLMAPLRLATEDADDLEQVAGSRIVREMNRRQAEGLSPFLEDRDIVRLVQPLLKRFTGSVGPKTPTNGKARLTKGAKETEEQFQRRAAKADQLRTLRTTSGQPVTRARPAATTKRRAGEKEQPVLMADRIKALRNNEL